MEGWAGLRGKGEGGGTWGGAGAAVSRTRRGRICRVVSPLQSGQPRWVVRTERSGELLPRHLSLKEILRPEQESPSVPPRDGEGPPAWR